MVVCWTSRPGTIKENVRMTRSLKRFALAAGCAALMTTAACGSDSEPGADGGADADAATPDGGTAETGAGAGGPVAGAVDNHCGTKVQATSEASCKAPVPDGGVPIEEEAPPMYNASGDDDDCKYHLSFTTTPVAKNSDIFITAVVMRKSDSKPATDADVEVEGLVSPTHPIPNSDAKTVETSPGTYKIGPLRFDASGRWTVRFHLYETCNEAQEDSPHGHAGFYFDVP
jgi:hypothetical protein